MAAVTSVQQTTCESPGSLGLRVVRTEKDGIRWRVADTWSDRVLASEAPDWLALEDDPRARQIKLGHQRCTWSVALGADTVFAKVIDLSGGAFANRLRLWFGVTSVEREWRVSKVAQERDVPVVRCLAVGIRGGAQPRGVLLSEGIRESNDLWKTWGRNVLDPGSRRHSVAATVIEAVAELYARAHRRGFVHRDGHPRNILVCSDRAGDLSAVFVDVAGAHLSAGLAADSRIVDSLGQLAHAFRSVTTRTERLRFLRQYLSRLHTESAGSDSCRSQRRLTRDIADAEAVHAARLARQRDRRLWRDGKYFSTFSPAVGWRVAAVLRLERRQAFPETQVADWTLRQWRETLRPALIRLPYADSREDLLSRRGACMEVGRPRSLLASMGWTLCGSPHRRAFARCHQLRHRDLDSRLVLACAEHRNRAGLVDMAVLIRPVQDSAKTDQGGKAKAIPGEAGALRHNGHSRRSL